ncbi:MAG: class I SAM-dependent methyltransferase, partial [Actinomycetota bacterium]|nr:class I SAM-dependent methyltransferase [Actinomycetota bacterium]
LTQALCEHFDRCDGVDIAPSMIERAQGWNRHGSRCSYHLNTSADLADFPDGAFDVVFCYLVLQHMEPELAKGYVAEFMRLLAPGGVAVFQVPEDWRPPELLTAEERQADLALIGGLPRLTAGQSAQIRVSVTNTSTARWSNWETSAFAVRVGAHWRCGPGELVINDDGRAELPGDLGPGERTEVDLVVQVPPSGGRWILEVDVVEEGAAWFGHGHSTTLALPVTVGSPRRDPERLLRRARAVLGGWRGKAPGVTAAMADGAPPAPVMEMYCLPRIDIERIVEAAGATMVDVTEDGRPGGWVSLRYVVTNGTDSLS